MTPKKIYLSGYGLKNIPFDRDFQRVIPFVSVEALHDWIDQQSQTGKDLGWMALLVKLETFLNEEK